MASAPPTERWEEVEWMDAKCSHCNKVLADVGYDGTCLVMMRLKPLSGVEFIHKYCVTQQQESVSEIAISKLEFVKGVTAAAVMRWKNQLANDIHSGLSPEHIHYIRVFPYQDIRLASYHLCAKNTMPFVDWIDPSLLLSSYETHQIAVRPSRSDVIPEDEPDIQLRNFNKLLKKWISDHQEELKSLELSGAFVAKINTGDKRHYTFDIVLVVNAVAREIVHARDIQLETGTEVKLDYKMIDVVTNTVPENTVGELWGKRKGVLVSAFLDGVSRTLEQAGWSMTISAQSIRPYVSVDKTMKFAASKVVRVNACYLTGDAKNPDYLFTTSTPYPIIYMVMPGPSMEKVIHEMPILINPDHVNEIVNKYGVTVVPANMIGSFSTIK